MNSFYQKLPEIALLIFLSITFLFSFWDKVSDWKGNIDFLENHFKDTFVPPFIKSVLFFIVIMELMAGLFAVVGMYEVVFDHVPRFAIYSCILSLLCLFIFLVGQRVAKDFDGAMKIVVYIIPTIFCLYLLLIGQ